MKPYANTQHAQRARELDPRGAAASAAVPRAAPSEDALAVRAATAGPGAGVIPFERLHRLSERRDRERVAPAAPSPMPPVTLVGSAEDADPAEIDRQNDFA